MKNIQKQWKEFIEDDKYKIYFMSNKEEWYDKLQKVKKYINTHKQRPYKSDKNSIIKQLGEWISNQQTNYRKKNDIMKNEDIQKQWKEFIEDKKYNKYFINNNNNKSDLESDSEEEIKKKVESSSSSESDSEESEDEKPVKKVTKLIAKIPTKVIKKK